MHVVVKYFFPTSRYERQSIRLIFAHSKASIETTRNNLLNQKGIYSGTCPLLPHPSLSLHDAGWGGVTVTESTSPFLAICPVSLLLGTQIAVITQSRKHLSTHPKPQCDSAWFSTAVLGPDPVLEDCADQKDRDQSTDSDWGPSRNVYACTVGRQQWRLRQKKWKWINGKFNQRHGGCKD